MGCLTGRHYFTNVLESSLQIPLSTPEWSVGLSATAAPPVASHLTPALGDSNRALGLKAAATLNDPALPNSVFNFAYEPKDELEFSLCTLMTDPGREAAVSCHRPDCSGLGGSKCAEKCKCWLSETVQMTRQVSEPCPTHRTAFCHLLIAASSRSPGTGLGSEARGRPGSRGHCRPDPANTPGPGHHLSGGDSV